MSVVKGFVIDSSTLDESIDEGVLRLLLTRLRHGGCRVAMLWHTDMASAQQALADIITNNNGDDDGDDGVVHVYVDDENTTVVTLSSTMHEWSLDASQVAVVVGDSCDDAALRAVQRCGCALWHAGHSTADSAAARVATVNVPHIKLLCAAYALQVKAAQPSTVVVGYAMKRSRELDLLRRGLLPLLPLDDCCFVALDLDLALDVQGPIDVVLQKATDELQNIPDSSISSANVPQFSGRAAALQQYCDAHGVLCIDPLHSIQTIVHRAAMGSVLDTLAQHSMQHGVIRGAAWLQIDDFGDEACAAVTAAGLRPPLIVKSATACGPDDSHQMALVRDITMLRALSVPLPAVVQQFHNHGGQQTKVYVIGSHVFCHSKASIPDCLDGDGPGAGTGVAEFHSLKGLPGVVKTEMVDAPKQGPQTGSVPRHANEALIDEAAARLRTKLSLTLFGFDVIVDSMTGDHIIIDVNAFPSYKGVPEAGRCLRTTIVELHRVQSKS